MNSSSELYLMENEITIAPKQNTNTTTKDFSTTSNNDQYNHIVDNNEEQSVKVVDILPPESANLGENNKIDGAVAAKNVGDVIISNIVNRFTFPLINIPCDYDRINTDIPPRKINAPMIKTTKKRRRKKSKHNFRMKLSKQLMKTECFSNSGRRGGGGDRISVQSLAPYNTNKFLMEEHMPKMIAITARTRDSSFSIDSDENNSCIIPQPQSQQEHQQQQEEDECEEDFLTKEFSHMYEIAKSERLETLTKPELIQEYLLLEASVEKLTALMKSDKGDPKDNNFENVIQKLELTIHDLTNENQELRQQIKILRAQRNKRYRSHGVQHNTDNNSNWSSVDSESDSTSDSDIDSIPSEINRRIDDNNDEMKLTEDNEEDKRDCKNYINENESNQNQLTEKKVPSVSEDFLNTP